MCRKSKRLLQHKIACSLRVKHCSLFRVHSCVIRLIVIMLKLPKNSCSVQTSHANTFRADCIYDSDRFDMESISFPCRYQTEKAKVLERMEEDEDILLLKQRNRQLLVSLDFAACPFWHQASHCPAMTGIKP